MNWIKKAAKKAQDATTPETNQKPVASGKGSSGGPAAAKAGPVQYAGGITTQVRVLGRQQSNLPHIFRDGGGGGVVDGHGLIIFADSSYTRGPPPTDASLLVGFVSNSIALLGGDGSNNSSSAIQTVVDTGSMEHGPELAVPFCADDGEAAATHGVWPNQNIAAVQGGTVGVTFPEVVDRRLFSQGKQPFLYNTPVEIRLQAGGGCKGSGLFGGSSGHSGGLPRAVGRRPQAALFRYGEPLFGSFTTFAEDEGSARDDGYLYLFARISETDGPASNGLKLARVRRADWADRARYEYWNGQTFGPALPASDDGGRANVYSYSQEAFGKHYGPGTGDIFWSALYSEYVLIFQNAAAALDNSVYLSHSRSLTGGWSPAECIFKLPHEEDGYSYAFHTYAFLDATGRRVPITWTQDSKSKSCFINTGEILFS